MKQLSIPRYFKPCLYLIILFLFNASSCINIVSNNNEEIIDSKNKGKYKNTIELAPKLYEEMFITYSSGAYNADLYSSYLTDSVNFIVKIGDYSFAYEQYYCEINKDTIIVNYQEEINGISKIQMSKQKKITRTQLEKLKNIDSTSIPSIYSIN